MLISEVHQMQFRPRFDQPYVILSLIFHVLVIVRSISILNSSNINIAWNDWDPGQRSFMITSIGLMLHSAVLLVIQHSKFLLFAANSIYIMSVIVSATDDGLGILLSDHSLEIFLAGGTVPFFFLFIVFHIIIYPLFRIIQFMRS